MRGGVTSGPGGCANARCAGPQTRVATATAPTTKSYRATRPAKSAPVKPRPRATSGICAPLPPDLQLRRDFRSLQEQQGCSFERAPRVYRRFLPTSRVRRATVLARLRRGQPAVRMQHVSAHRCRRCLIGVRRATTDLLRFPGPVMTQVWAHPAQAVQNERRIPALKRRLLLRDGQRCLSISLRPRERIGVVPPPLSRGPLGDRWSMLGLEAKPSQIAFWRLGWSLGAGKPHQIPRLQRQQSRLPLEPPSGREPTVQAALAAKQSRCSVDRWARRDLENWTRNSGRRAHYWRAQPDRQAGPIQALNARAMPSHDVARDRCLPVVESRFSKPFQRNTSETEVAQSARRRHQLWRLLASDARHASAGGGALLRRSRCFVNVKRRAACRN